MLKQEIVDELRIAIYEDVEFLYEFYSDKWEEDVLKDAQEYVPGLTMEELKEYHAQDAPYLAAVFKLAVKAGADENLFNRIFDADRQKAYDAVKEVAGDSIPFEDFVDILEYGGKPFFKSFEGVDLEGDELSDDELMAVAGGAGPKNEENLIWDAILKKWVKVILPIVACFTAESMVETPLGEKPIKDICKGDAVYSLDEAGNRVETKVLEKTSAERKVVEVHFEDGSVWNTTSTQFFFDGRRKHDIWQHNGRNVVTIDGVTKITDIVETGKKVPVYDLVMAGNNIMFISGVAAEGFGN
ncbi:MAG: hypothetical protein J6O61_17870 [Butyrivibrio sp.]|uniref:Hint domain-containing protein n=1 Tax=Butyrivibrio sp. TaxID=28121 RepID=UPI001B1E5F1D|nr:Hint domain-containing protein [Butyrivibrio sp.]MBO6242672.1 hypothetical protein [Butyrivibrio sp.]